MDDQHYCHLPVNAMGSFDEIEQNGGFRGWKIE
jgi:hypothetical protein